MNFLGAEDTQPVGQNSWEAWGGAAGNFLQALGYGNKEQAGPVPFNWTPVFILGGVAVGGLVLFGAMNKTRRRRRR